MSLPLDKDTHPGFHNTLKMVCCYPSHPYIALPTLTVTPGPPTQVALAELDEVATVEDWQRNSSQSTEGSLIDSEVAFSLAEITSETPFTQQQSGPKIEDEEPFSWSIT